MVQGFRRLHIDPVAGVHPAACEQVFLIFFLDDSRWIFFRCYPIFPNWWLTRPYQPASGRLLRATGPTRGRQWPWMLILGPTREFLGFIRSWDLNIKQRIFGLQILQEFSLAFTHPTINDACWNVWWLQFLRDVGGNHPRVCAKSHGAIVLFNDSWSSQKFSIVFGSPYGWEMLGGLKES